MRLIDANVFIYAAGTPHPLREPCRDVLSAVNEGQMEANTDVEVLQELLHFYSARRRFDLGKQVFERAADAFPMPFTVDLPILRSAAVLLERYPRIQSRDAVHAAVVLGEGLEGIISTDRGFDDIPGVTRFDPREMR